MASASSTSDIEIWVRDQHRLRCCGKDGKPAFVKTPRDLRTELFDLRPNDKELIRKVIKKINQELYEMSPQQYSKLIVWVKNECRRFPMDDSGQLRDKAAVIAELHKMRPDYHPTRIDQAVKIAQKSGIKACEPSQPREDKIPVPSRAQELATTTAEDPSTNPDLESWVHQQFFDIGFKSKSGFIGYKKLQRKLRVLNPEREDEISSIIQKLRQPGHELSFPAPESVLVTRKLQSTKTTTILSNSNAITKTHSGVTPTQSNIVVTPQRPQSLGSTPSASLTQSICNSNAVTNTKEQPTLSGPMQMKSPSVVPQSRQQGVAARNQGSTVAPKTSTLPSGVKDHSKTENSAKHPQALASDKPSSRLNHQQNLLLVKRSSDDGGYSGREEFSYDIRNAVLVSANIVEETDEKILPQYGLLGSFHPDSCLQLKSPRDDRIFVNTNIPFSAFICGVQGSGKSHTTSCLLENCLIPSLMLGHLQKPLSALVFHFSEFTSRTSHNPSEASFLSMAHCDFPDHPTASHTSVMVPPSNYYNLNQLYTRIPKVDVHPFKLKPHMLDVGTMLVLMTVDQSKDKSLYMAQVTKILRDIATERNGDFDYLDFKRRLSDQNFDRKQRDFLNQRLDLLESFLDLDSSSTDLAFGAGEVTIIDMSCPFVDSNTACVLFKIAMKKYLESSVAGKMIVLDEAHKYMIDTPGATDLNEFLLTVIRQQRHFGARVIVSTQEPTISTQLIGLCAITVIHRFTSPDWFRALKTHISISSSSTEGEKDEKYLFRKIVNLRTGEALIYAPTAVLGKDLTGNPVKATEELLKVSIRKRVTWDGGQSRVCV